MYNITEVGELERCGQLQPISCEKLFNFFIVFTDLKETFTLQSVLPQTFTFLPLVDAAEFVSINCSMPFASI